MNIQRTLFVAIILLFTAVGYAQTVTLKAKNISLQEVFSRLEKQTDYFFICNQEVLKKAGNINVNVEKESLSAALQKILKEVNLVYTFKGKYVVIAPRGTQVEADKTLTLVIRGRVVDGEGRSLADASVEVKGENVRTVSNDEGYFELNGGIGNVVVISYIGFERKEYKVVNGEMATVVLERREGRMDTAEVVVRGSTGYQVIDKKHPGSFNIVDNKLLNRKISTDILSRIENLTPGVSFKNSVDGILIRGRNSIFSNVSPLIIVDNFPYDGDINNINPNDVDKITILKDAAAAAQWGARAGNGVIVITTKRGKTSKPLVDLNMNFTIQGRPNLENLQIISSSDEINLEKWLFAKGYYDGNISNTGIHPPLSPVQEVLLQQRNGDLDQVEANRILEKFKGINAVDDLKKYFYRSSGVQQYSLNVSGISPKVNYYMSVGWDKRNQELVGSQNDRITVRSINTFKVAKGLELEGGITYTQANTRIGNNPGTSINSGFTTGLYPYADLVDENGKGLPIVKEFSNAYKEGDGKTAPLDWNYIPYDEINREQNRTNLRDFLLNTGVKYTIFNFINLELRYQFENMVSTNRILKEENSYYVRDLINKFYQPEGPIKYPVPLGGILNNTISETMSHQGRIQASINKTWNRHVLNTIVGWEIKNLKETTNASKQFGYKREGSVVSSSMDFITEFPQFHQPGNTSRVHNEQGVSESLDRILSLYFNSIYTFDNRYTISGSIRKDAANLFGAKTNQRGIPLWSLGINWELSNERFYSSHLITLLKLRASYGFNGNFSRISSGATTMLYEQSRNIRGLSYATIMNPLNERLRWEQDRIMNVGIDFELRKRRIWGTLEFYKKNNKDLMASAPTDPTNWTLGNGGQSYILSNVANVKGSGYELELNFLNLNRKVNWTTNFLFSYSSMKVAEYFLPAPESSLDYVASEYGINPIVGKPVFSSYSYKWAGLDPKNGNPRGYIGKNISSDYDAIFSSTKIDSLSYKGPVQPPVYGAFRNTFTYKNVSFSFNISYKFGYYFRRTSVSYLGLFQSWTGHSDYAERWQQPGDENRTTVPSLVYVTDPEFSNRTAFYYSSEALVEKGDHIRLEDITFGYIFSKAKANFPFESIRIYSNITNLGVLWKRNKMDLDPYYINGNISRVQYAIGVNVTF